MKINITWNLCHLICIHDTNLHIIWFLKCFVFPASKTQCAILFLKWHNFSLSSLRPARTLQRRAFPMYTVCCYVRNTQLCMTQNFIYLMTQNRVSLTAACKITTRGVVTPHQLQNSPRWFNCQSCTHCTTSNRCVLDVDNSQHKWITWDCFVVGQAQISTNGEQCYTHALRTAQGVRYNATIVTMRKDIEGRKVIHYFIKTIHNTSSRED